MFSVRTSLNDRPPSTPKAFPDKSISLRVALLFNTLLKASAVCMLPGRASVTSVSDFSSILATDLQSGSFMPNMALS
ncbi:MAG: hypothetical protein FRX49_04818 [Trebouxia sp. A1-2]|nr:MAG: hypothetical protein FRX49_04818 [Trebouxia sp. A1-2]